ncbi:MAG TPA: hypothetical protein VF168_10865 [Trueperaceae bacterium]
MTVRTVPTLSTALLLAGLLVACAGIGDLGDLIPSDAGREVTVRAEGPGRVTLARFQVDCSDECVFDAPLGTVLHPQPVPDPGARFWYWGGSCSGAGECAVLVDSDVDFVAVFQRVAAGGTTDQTDDDSGTTDPTDDTGGTTDPTDDGGTTGPAGDGVVGGQDDGEGTEDPTDDGIGDGTDGDIDDGTGRDDGPAPGDDDQTADQGPGIDGRYTISLELTGAGGGVVEVPSLEFVCTGGCTMNLDPGETVEMIPVPDQDSFFSHWTGACEGAGGTCTVTMEEDLVLRAQFRLDEKPLLVTIEPVPDGGTVTGEAIDCGDDSDLCTSDHASGETLVLEALPAADFRFAGWTGACAASSGTTCEFAINSDATVSAEFEGRVPMRELTVVVEGNADGEVLFPDGESCDQYGACDQHFPAGSKVTLTAQPTGGGYIDGWEGVDCEPHAPTCAITMDGDRTVTVSFHTRDLEFILRIEEPVGGTIESDRLSCGDGGDDCRRDFAFDDHVQLRAIPSAGYEFVSWGGDCSGSQTPVCDLVFRDSKDVSATFRAM